MTAFALDLLYNQSLRGVSLDWYWYLLVFALALVATLLATPLSMRIARRFDIIDYPDARRVNTRPTPRLGGIALFIGVLVAIGVFALIENVSGGLFTIRGIMRGINYLGVAGSLTVIFLVGLLDDFLELSALTKFIGQVIAAIIAAASGVLLEHLINPLDGRVIDLGFFAYPITVFYLVAFVNIINLIDGLDGLAAGIVAISAGALFVLALGKGGYDAAIVSVAVLGACLGFLRFNFYPARGFMGDSGALLLGFILGVISLFSVLRTPALVSLLVPMVVAGIPVIDTFTSIVRRLRSGRSIARADVQHIHHRFINLGFSQRTTVLVMYGLSALLSLSAVIIARYAGAIRIAIFAVLCIGVILLVWRLGLLGTILTHHYNRRERPDGRIGPPPRKGHE
jgi:UDP-GlcNAc:undecaprenyl-phosphate GlcNAc-1-phosphate transferase